MSETLPQAELERRIRAALPTLPFATAVLDAYGEDNYVALLDSTWIVRFPRNDQQRSRFVAELNLLRVLRKVSPVPVPNYEYVAEDRSMGAYRIIPGNEMAPPIFSGLARPGQDVLLARLGGFLAVLHALPEETIRQPDGTIQRTWSGKEFAELYFGVRREAIARMVPTLVIERFDAFHEELANVAPGVARLAHNDLSDDHILISENGMLSGIIDFTDAAYGDPAIDFAWFWRLGEDAVDRVFSAYALARHDPELKSRSRWIAVRYLINQIWYGSDARWNLALDAALVELEPHLEALGF